MQIQKLTILALLAWSIPAAADFKTVSLASEVPLTEFNVPVTNNGVISYRECAECEIYRGRMTPATRFRVNGEHVELREFRERVLSVRDRATKTVVILRHLESQTITSISIGL